VDSVETGDEIKSCARSSRTTGTESFVFACLTYKNVQRFRNGLVHKFYGLKASQMCKVRASSHEYPDVEKIRNLHEQNLKGEANNKQLDSEDTQRSDFRS